MSDTTRPEFVLADPEKLSIWNFYPSFDAAEAEASRVNSYESTQQNPSHYQPMSYAEYVAHERQTYLSRPAEEITHERYWDALEVLPPKHFTRVSGCESFLMLEHWSGPYTSQFVAYRGRYFTKLVDAFDKSTWLTAATLPTVAPRQAAPAPQNGEG